MQLFIAKNKKIGDEFAFNLIKKQIIKKPNSLIGLAVGKTTDSLYKLISLDSKKKPKKWSKLKLFQIDEKIGVSCDSKSSFNFEIRKELSSLFKILPKKNYYLIDGVKNPKETIKEAYLFIRKNKGIDLIILGIGPEYDPHVAYNTSGKSKVSSRMRVVELHPKISMKIRKRMGEEGKGGKGEKGKRGITLGIKDILECKKALLIAYGKDKAESIKLAFGGKVNLKRASASALLLHKDLTVLVDKDAIK